ncbi:MAG: hypothetical protein U0175_24890 [Caldilineaceae bacterium]
MAKTVTVGQIAKALRCHEQSARSYLSEVCEQFDCYTSNLGEHVEMQIVYKLWKRHLNSQVGKRLTPLLQMAQ